MGGRRAGRCRAFEFWEKSLFKLPSLEIEMWVKCGHIAPPQVIYLLFKSLNATIKPARVRVRVLIQISPHRNRTSRLNAPPLQLICDRQQSHLNLLNSQQSLINRKLPPGSFFHIKRHYPRGFLTLRVTDFGGCALKVQLNNFKPQTNSCFANTTAFLFRIINI